MKDQRVINPNYNPDIDIWKSEGDTFVKVN